MQTLRLFTFEVPPISGPLRATIVQQSVLNGSILVIEQRAREREQRAREREQRAREQAEAVVAELRERVSALEQERLAREQAEVVIAQLQKEVAALRRELDATHAHTPMPHDGKEN